MMLENDPRLLRNHDQHFQTGFMNAAVGIACVSREGKFLKVNAKYCEITGYSEAELTARTLVDITHPDDIAISANWAAELIERKRPFANGIKRYLHRQGHPVWASFSIAPIFDADGELDSYLTFFEDITEKKLSEELLCSQKEVLEFMVRNKPLNATLARIVRMIEEQAPGCLSTIYVVKDGKLRMGAAPSFPESFIKAVDGCPIGPSAGSCGAAAFSRTRQVSTDIAHDESGVWGPFKDWALSYGLRAAWSTPVLSKDGEAIGTVSMCWREPKEPTRLHFELVDVATRLMGIAIERDHTETLLKDQQAKMIASSKLAALGEMAAGLAHEINNPLAIIQTRATQLSMMASRGKLDAAAYSEIAGSIQGTTERISKIIKGLRSFAREVDSEEIVTVSVISLVESTLAFCRERFKTHGVELRTDRIPGDLLLECRPVQMSQVLLNLLNNSFDAVDSLEEKWIEISTLQEAKQISLSVTDSGGGIPRELREQIMQPFFTTKSSDRGTGLGLSISAGLISAHHGRLLLDEKCPNTRFIIQLPRSQHREVRP